MLSDKLKKLRKDRNLTQVRLASLLGIPQSTYSGYEAGSREPDIEMLDKLANYFGVSVDYLLGREDSAAERPMPSNVYPVSKIIEIPILGSVRAGVGGCLTEDRIGTQAIPIEFIHGRNPADLFYLRVKGDSMYPRIEEGALALVHRQSSVDSGSVAVLAIDLDEAVLKKVYYGNDWIDLVSYNPNYPTRRFSGADVQRVCVIGQVLSVLNEL